MGQEQRQFCLAIIALGAAFEEGARATEIQRRPSMVECFSKTHVPESGVEELVANYIEEIADASGRKILFSVCIEKGDADYMLKADLKRSRLIYSPSLFSMDTLLNEKNPVSYVELAQAIHPLLFAGSQPAWDADYLSGYVTAKQDLSKQRSEEYYENLPKDTLAQRSLSQRRLRSFRAGWRMALTDALPDKDPLPDKERPTPEIAPVELPSPTSTSAPKSALSFAKNSMEYVAAVGGGVTVLYGLYRWIMLQYRTRRRRIRSQLD